MPISIRQSAAWPAAGGDPDIPALSPWTFCSAAVRALELAGVAVVLCGPDAEIRYRNGAAGRREALVPLKTRGERLCAGDEMTTRRLHAAIRAAVRSGCTTRVSTGPGSAARTIAVAPAESGPGEPVMAIVVVNPGPSSPDAPPDSTLRLTPSEARLLAALSSGERLAAYAARSGVKLTTVKTHLESLFDKTGERRQSDLVRRALCDPRLRAYLAS